MRNLTLTLFLLLGTAVSTAGVPATQLTETDVIRWDTSLSLPQLDGTPNIGIAGVFSGRIDGKLLIAGGANFPDRTPEANGEKRYHQDLYLYDASRGWQVIRDALPAPRAYGISVTLPEGVLCIGGCDASDCTDQVSLLTLDGDRPRFTPWPSLPRPLANAAGALVGHRIYVAGGIEQVGGGTAATRNFFMLDLHDRGRGWQELPPWPGPARAFAVAASQSDGFDNCFYLFSGRDFSGDSPWTVHKDGYRYNPRLGSWDRLEGEFPVMAGTAAPFGTNHILLIGGRNGTNSDDRMLRLYHTITETLTEVPVSDEIDLPVTTNVLPDDDGILITSGEIRPGVRTPVLLRGTLQSTIHRLTGLDIGVITLYFLSLALIGWYFSKNQKTSDDYFKGGGRIPWFIVGLSIFGTALSAITFMAIPAKAYATDWSYLLFNSGIVLAVPVIVLLFIPFYRRLNVTTAYEYLEARFNPLVRILCSIAFILFQIGRMGVVLLLPSIALNVVTGFDIFLCITLMGILSLAYTLMGGIEAVAWTEAHLRHRPDHRSALPDHRHRTRSPQRRLRQRRTDHSGHHPLLSGGHGAVGLLPPLSGGAEHGRPRQRRHPAVVYQHPAPVGRTGTDHRRPVRRRHVNAQQQHELRRNGFRHGHSPQTQPRGTRRPRAAAHGTPLHPRTGARRRRIRIDDGFVGDQIAVGRIFEDPRHPARRSGRIVSAGPHHPARQYVRRPVRHRGQHRRADSRRPQRVCQPAALLHDRIPFVFHRRLSGEPLRTPQRPRHRFADHLRKTKTPDITRPEPLLHRHIYLIKQMNNNQPYIMQPKISAK